MNINSDFSRHFTQTGSTSSHASQAAATASPNGPSSTAYTSDCRDESEELIRRLETLILNRNSQLPQEESIALLMRCIKLGEQEAAKAQGKDLVVFIGDTGAGKSALINYLFGCTMKRRYVDGDEIIDVIPVAQGGAVDAVMPIGHDSKSSTFLPTLTPNEKELTYCDCPGFLDTRGPEINIGNAVNIKNICQQARSVRFVILSEFLSLKTGKGYQVRKLRENLEKLFGGEQILREKMGSLLFGVSKIPLRRSGEESISLQELRERIVQIEPHDRALRELVQQLFIYDPEDHPERLLYSEGITRERIVTAITLLDPIDKPNDTLKTVLSSEDVQKLGNIATQITGLIESTLKTQELTTSHFKQIASYKKSLHQLALVDHAIVPRLLERAEKGISEYFQQQVHQFTQECLQANTELVAHAESLLKKIKEEAQHFDEQVQEKINFPELNAQYATLVLKLEARKDASLLVLQEREFYQNLTLANIFKAHKILEDMRSCVHLFDLKYSRIGQKHGIAIEKLEEIYTKAKRQLDEIDQARKEIIRLALLKKEFESSCEILSIKKAQLLLSEIEKSIREFDTRYTHTGQEHGMSIADLNAQFISMKKTYASKVQEKRVQLLKLVEEFRTHCLYYKCKKAEKLLQDIEQSARDFEANYTLLGDSHGISLEELRTRYRTSHLAHQIQETSRSNDLAHAYSEYATFKESLRLVISYEGFRGAECRETPDIKQALLQETPSIDTTRFLLQLERARLIFFLWMEASKKIGEPLPLTLNEEKVIAISSGHAMIDQAIQQEEYSLIEQWFISHQAKIQTIEFLSFHFKVRYTKAPELLGAFTGLQELWLDGVKELPESIGNLIHLKKLRSIGNTLSCLPESIGALTNLKILKLTQGLLQTIPESIGNLKNLKILNLERNHLCSVPTSIGNLTRLTKLCLKSNLLMNLDSAIGCLKNLLTLNLDFNKLSNVPESISTLTQLKNLFVACNQLTHLPNGIGNLKNLAELEARYNKLTSLPESIGELINMQKLSLSNNRLESVPASIGNLTCLEVLQLDENNLTALPESLGGLTKIKKLILRFNKLRTLPMSIGNWREIEELNLKYNELISIPETIGDLVQVQYLYLGKNSYHSLPTSISNLVNLKIISVRNVSNVIDFMKCFRHLEGEKNSGDGDVDREIYFSVHCH